MSTPSQIRSTASNVSSKKNTVKSGASSSAGQVSRSSDWWQGNAGEALRSKYTEIQKKIETSFSAMTTIESELRELASSVERAEREEREEKAALKRGKK